MMKMERMVGWGMDPQAIDLHGSMPDVRTFAKDQIMTTADD
jgi:hypothetical protein